MEEFSTFVDSVTLICTLATAWFGLHTYKSNVKHDRKIATLDAYNRLQEQALDELQKYMPAQIKEIVKDNRSDEYKKISAYVARIEHFAVGVNHEIYDWEVVYELSHGFLDQAIKTRIEIVIAEKNKNSTKDYYSNIHKLYAQMKKQEDEENQQTNLNRSDVENNASKS